VTDRRRTLELAAAGVFVFLASIALYTWTLAPTVTLVDSGELILAAYGVGVAHPPGFPLYLLLAHLATLVPIGTIAVRVNFASALFGALAAAVMTLVVAEAMRAGRRPEPTPAPQKKRERGRNETAPRVEKATPRESTPPDRLAWVATSVFAGFSLAFSRTLWAYATVAEVYTLNTLLILIIFLLMLRWRRRRLDAAPSAPPDDSVLQSAAFVFGLGLGVHHVRVGLMLPALAAIVWFTDGASFFTSRRLATAALFAIAGLTIYVYLPLAASKSPLMNWGDPRTLQRVWWHITGKQYQEFLSFSLTAVGGQFVEFVRIGSREFGPRWLPLLPVLAIVGLVALFRRDRAMFAFLTLAIGADLAYTLGYDIAEDKDAYFLPVFIAVVIAASFGVRWLVDRLRAMRPATAPYVATAAILVPIGALVANLPYDNRHRYTIASDYVDNIMAAIEPGGMLLTSDWQVYSPTLYTRDIEHRRQDVVAIDINLLRRSWYYAYLDRAYPITMALARAKVDAFLEDLRHWDQDPEIFKRDRVLNERITTRFDDMVLTLIGNHMRSAPVYATLDVAGNRNAVNAPLTSKITSAFQYFPRGLVFRLSTGSGVPAPAEIPLVTRGLDDGTLRFEDDDVVRQKVLPVYTLMLYNQGRQFAAANRRDLAVGSYKRALTLDPNFILAKQALEDR